MTRTLIPTTLACLWILFFCTFPVRAQQPDCKDNIKLTLHLDQYEMKLTPKAPACVVAGAQVKINLVIPNSSDLQVPAGAARVAPKTMDDKIIPAENQIDGNGKNEIIFAIPASATLDAEYSYYIEVDSVGTIDPIVRVVSSNVYIKAREETLAAAREELEASLEELEASLFPPLVREPEGTSD